jgi:hypothetical protein
MQQCGRIPLFWKADMKWGRTAILAIEEQGHVLDWAKSLVLTNGNMLGL